MLNSLRLFIEMTGYFGIRLGYAEVLLNTSYHMSQIKYGNLQKIKDKAKIKITTKSNAGCRSASKGQGRGSEWRGKEGKYDEVEQMKARMASPG